ncbi:hypothetical protein [Paenibacillus nasutitermitis]|uniref:Uncharacterized protein n=1 Tax=Paenibacillus nasutitermitis TaxID=1652958 RepID=A0A916ZC99_9BACL|nr:hypothetical protein [Paenibacillus nasutitermitis]GGD86608.1 hypothetical protein GCM10010911_51350 [Paenibacillus nasutitermitis]
MTMKTYGYIEIEAIPDELLLDSVTELRGCAVLAALINGSLPRERLEHYVAQQHENKVCPGYNELPK